MTRAELEAAADDLRRAAERVGSDEAGDRLRSQADQFDTLATAKRGPDHGRLARHEHVLTEIAEDELAVADDIESALESIRAYRETVEGV